MSSDKFEFLKDILATDKLILYFFLKILIDEREIEKIFA